MKVEQIATLMNSVTNEILGKEDVVAEDLHNIVDVGKEILDATDVDNYVKKLLDHIGKIVFTNRVYRGSTPSIMMDSWEYGSVLEKVTADMPEAEENDSWKLTNGQVYEQDKFTAPSVSVKFFNKKVTFDVPISFTEMQVKSSFSSPAQLNGFLSMITNAIDRSMTVKLDSLVQRTINNMTAITLHESFDELTDLGTKTSVRAVNLIKAYKDDTGIVVADIPTALNDGDFLRWCAMYMGLYVDRMGKLSTLFNIGGKDRFTDKENLHVIMLSEFIKHVESVSYANTFHDNFVKLPNAEQVPYWQGSGKNYSFTDTSTIHVTANDGETGGTGVEVNVSGIVGVMFDRDALGVSNLDKRITTHYNAKAEFYNNWYKADAGYFNDFNENFVVFFLAPEPQDVEP